MNAANIKRIDQDVHCLYTYLISEAEISHLTGVTKNTSSIRSRCPDADTFSLRGMRGRAA